MINVTVNKINLNAVKQNYKRAINRLPKKLGAVAVQYIHGNFRAQGFVDRGVQKWKPRKSQKNRGRAILVKSGRLRRDVRVRRTTTKFVTIGTSLPYARIHNDGGTINHPGGTAYFFDKKGEIVYVKNSTASRSKRNFRRTRPHRINMPARPYMPSAKRQSRKLNRMLTKVIQQEINKLT